MTTRSDSGRLRTPSLLFKNPWEERGYRSSSDARATRGLRLGRWPLVCHARRHACTFTWCAFFPTVRASLRQW